MIKFRSQLEIEWRKAEIAVTMAWQGFSALPDQERIVAPIEELPSPLNLDYLRKWAVPGDVSDNEMHGFAIFLSNHFSADQFLTLLDAQHSWINSKNFER